MEKITGRTDDMMIVRGVNVFPTQIEEQILLVEGLTPHYLCVLTRPGRLDELTVQVEAAPGLTDRAASRRPAVPPHQGPSRRHRHASRSSTPTPSNAPWAKPNESRTSEPRRNPGSPGRGSDPVQLDR